MSKVYVDVKFCSTLSLAVGAKPDLDETSNSDFIPFYESWDYSLDSNKGDIVDIDDIEVRANQAGKILTFVGTAKAILDCDDGVDTGKIVKKLRIFPEVSGEYKNLVVTQKCKIVDWEVTDAK